MARSEEASGETKKARQPRPSGKAKSATSTKTAATNQQKTRKKTRPGSGKATTTKTASPKGQRPSPKKQGSSAAKAKRVGAKAQRSKQPAQATASKHVATRGKTNAQVADKSKTSPSSSKKKKDSQPLTLRRVAAYVLPVLSLAAAFVAVVFLYRHIMPQSTTDVATATAGQVIETSVPSTDANAYIGVKDKWVPEGYFTTGNKDLDKQVKAFCDALTQEGANARANAQNVYNNIVWSNIEWRDPSDKPAGPNWVAASARHYFETGSPELGIGGSGDEYEFSAVASLCLRYFGYYDALAIPVLRGTFESSLDSGAMVIVTDENGKECVCDTTLAANGFMLDRNLYNISVEDIGQDLTGVEARGLKVHKDNTSSSSSSTSSSSSPTSSPTSTSTSTSDNDLEQETGFDSAYVVG